MRDQRLPPDGPTDMRVVRAARWGSIDEGWWEAITVKVRVNGSLEWVWRDYGDEPGFVRNREQVALLNPAFKQA